MLEERGDAGPTEADIENVLRQLFSSPPLQQSDRISPEAAEQVLGTSRDAWSSATVHMELGSNLANEQSIETTLSRTQLGLSLDLLLAI